MKTEGKDAYTITEYQRFYNEGDRQAYRSQSEFRDLWPEFETPNELARQIVKQLNKRAGPGLRPTGTPVEAGVAPRAAADTTDRRTRAPQRERQASRRRSE
mgnify:CR=1 FL=1